MADEKDQPITQQGEEPTPIDPETAPEPIKEMQAKTIREIRAETVPAEQLPDPVDDVRVGEDEDDVDRRRELESVLDKPIEAVEDAINTFDRETTPQRPSDVLAHAVPNTTHVFGRFTVPLPIYDVVFISLFVFTIIEVLVGEIFDARSSGLVVLFLLAIAFVKAFHVVWYYMHLGSDNKIFWLTLLIPFFIAFVGLLYLIAVPVTGY